MRGTASTAARLTPHRRSQDTLCPGNNPGYVPTNCTVKTLGFIDTIEAAMAVFKGPKFHVRAN